MPVAKLRSSSSSDTMISEAGNDSLDTFIRQAIGKEPFLSFSRTGDSPVQWIQLLHAIDQQELPGWPLLSPLKIQMQKCDKCSREFCSPINYRRHIRVHRRSFNVDKDSHKNRDFLGEFWNKLSLEEAKEIVSFKDVTLEEVSGSSIIRSLMSFTRKPGICPLPQVYVRAGCALLDIVQAKPSGLPITSQEFFSLLDDASERTFLCAGTAESIQKFVFDGEAGKIGLETKNLVACTSFLLEQKLVRAWLADKDAESLRCQKLLVEEEEAAQRRVAEILEKKRQKKLRQKEQRAKEQQPSGENRVTVEEIPEIPPSAETSGSPPAVYESHSDATEIQSDQVTSPLQPVSLPCAEEADIEAAQSDSGTCQNVERQTMPKNCRINSLVSRWQAPKSQRGSSKNSFLANQNPQVSKHEHAQKHSGFLRDPRAGAGPSINNGNKVWTRKSKPENDAETLKTRLCEDAVNQAADQSNKKCEVIIGSIPVTLGNNHGELQENIQEKHTNRSPVKLWRPVNQHGSSSQEFEGKRNIQTVPSESCQQFSTTDENGGEDGNNSDLSLQQSAIPDGFIFSSRAAKDFLGQRWKEAVESEHVTLVLTPKSESPGRPPDGDADADANACVDQQVASSSLESQKGNNHQPARVEAHDSGVVGNDAKPNKSRTQPEKNNSNNKMKYIPKQRSVG